MQKHNLVAETGLETVTSGMLPIEPDDGSYQSEAELEAWLLNHMQAQGYELLTTPTHKGLKDNIRKQLERLNGHDFTEEDWENFYRRYIANEGENAADKVRRYHKDFVIAYTTGSGQLVNIKLVDKRNPVNNSLQVFNQFKMDGKRRTRFDVTILMNGLPMVQIELKRRGVLLREAFNQIERYKRDSFWEGSGLYEWVQLYVISNGTSTRYYSNTVRTDQELAVRAGKARTRAQSGLAQGNYKFTSEWTTTKNEVISDIERFTKTFLAPENLKNILTKYLVYTSDEKLLVLRPYQIAAVEAVYRKWYTAYSNKQYGTVDAGGYVWHTTGTGKTLTSFKLAQLLGEQPEIQKVIVVVDRLDLDYQTLKAFEHYEEGSVAGNTSTNILTKQLKSEDTKVILTTIQKLSHFMKRTKARGDKEAEALYDQHTVFIFDECHRSQFGEMHQELQRSFKKHYFYGFTGTPIFAVNAVGKSRTSTTKQIFGTQLHTYLITDAINDNKVLKFKVDTVNTMKLKDEEGTRTSRVEVDRIESTEALQAPERVEGIVEYIIDTYSQKTQNKAFNGLFAVTSIEAARKYYNEFKRQDHTLKVAMIYSYAPNEEVEIQTLGFMGEEDTDSTEALGVSDRDGLSLAIKDYNEMFGTSFDSGIKFKDYYKDVSERVRRTELDLLIVVNMFLTGFDAPKLNTLWVDKNLKHHGLIQAYSRTNRVYNDRKTHGNIIVFRDQQKELNEALALFSEQSEKGLIIILPYEDYYVGYTDEKTGKDVPGYLILLEELRTKYPLGVRINDDDKKSFIKLFGQYLKVRTILESFDEFDDEAVEITDRDYQNYKSLYLEYYDELKRVPETASVLEELEFELELVRRDEVGISYILEQIRLRIDDLNKETVLGIMAQVDSSPTLRPLKDLLQTFIDKLNAERGDIEFEDEWRQHTEAEKLQDIERVTEVEGLKGYVRNGPELIDFVNKSIKQGYFEKEGLEFGNLITLPYFTTDGSPIRDRGAVREQLAEEFEVIINKYYITGT